MKNIKLKLGDRSYNIIVGSGAVKNLPAQIKSSGFSGPVVVITDNVVWKKASGSMRSILSALSNEVVHIPVPSSERSKSIEVFQETVHRIAAKTRKHRPLIIAFGGGVVGDLAGFVAATYRRGVPFIQVPTTFLAQVDSSIGGKVGIDLPEAKNMIGAFYQPEAVISDIDLLSTLPQRQMRNGLGEVIKYAIISSGRLFSFLENNIEKVMAREKHALEKVIHECAAIKAAVVEKDERDVAGIRIALNFGHTLGHGIEAASGYSDLYNHGESVALGMLLASEMAVRLDMFGKDDLARIRDLVRRAGLPLRIKGLSVKDILRACEYDKKFITGGNRFVLPVAIGAVEVIDDVPVLLMKTALKEYVG